MPTNTATFAGATPTSIDVTATTTINTIEFTATAPAYSFTILSPNTMEILGTGIVNASSNAPTFSTDVGASLFFFNSSTAANAILTNNGTLAFFDSSTAGTATITTSGLLSFLNTSSADQATITINSGGALGFRNSSTAANATIVNNGSIDFLDSSTAGNAVVTTNNGAITFFQTDASGGQARFITNAGGTFDISGLVSGGTTAGSIEGAGNYVLGTDKLTVGGNNLSTEVTGVISGSGGSLDKVGTGTLTLAGTNTYTGPTTDDGGTLEVIGSLASPTSVNDTGTLSGTGTVNAPVTINSGGTLAPGTPAAPGTITLGPLTLNAGSTLSYRLGTPNVVGGPTNDLTNVNGALTINGDTLFVTNSAAFAPGTYRLINYTVGAAPGGVGQIVVGTLPDGDTGVIQTTIPGQVNLIVTTPPPATQFWDGANMVATGVPNGNGGNGTWNNTSTNWTNQPGTSNASWQGISAVFAGAPGTVTVADTIAYQSIQFSTGGYLLVAGPGGTLVPTGAAPIIVDGGLTATIAAPITGPGGLDKNGLGTLILTGTNSYTGGTTVSFGTLQIGNGGTTGSILGDVTNNGTLAFNRSDTFTFPGVISGTGELNQLGPGTLVLTGNSTYSGPTNVEGGALEVNGSIADSSLTTVNAGTTLFGTGTVGNTDVTGTFAPGNGTPGTSMTVNGNLTFQPGATYMVFVNPATSSFSTVTGTAALAGTVDASFAPGSYVAKQYLILQSAGLNGTMFAGLTTTGLGPGFVTSLSYNADDAFLNLTAALGAGTALNVNQQNVSNALNNFFNSGGALPPNFLNVFNLTGANLANALTLLSGENATGAERSAFGMMTQFLNLMTDPYVACSINDRRYCRELQALGFAPEQQASLPPELALAYASILKAPLKAPPPVTPLWTAWGAAFGGVNHAKGDDVIGSHDITASDVGFAAGMDYHYSPDTLFGFALAGGGTNWDLAQGLGTGRSDAFMAGLHGETRFGPAYLRGALGFANHWFTTDRTSFDNDQLRANFTGQSYGVRLEGGYRFAVPFDRMVIGITPYAAVQAQAFHTPTYSETDLTGGGFGLTYNSMTANDTRSELGARTDALTTFYGSPLILRSRLAWAHDWVDNPALSAAFQALPGSSFTVFGAPIPHDSALTTASAELHFAPNWSFTAKFDGEFASGSQTYAGTGTLRYTW